MDNVKRIRKERNKQMCRDSDATSQPVSQNLFRPKWVDLTYNCVTQEQSVVHKVTIVPGCRTWSFILRESN
jgi:hypothetical protein